MASTQTGPEAIEEAVAATLTSFLAGEMDALWTAAGDAASVPEVHPAVVAGHRALLPEYPVVVVTWLDATITEIGDTIWQGWAHRLDVSAYVMSDDMHVLDQQTKRIAWAMVKALAKHQKLDGSLPHGPTSVVTRRTGRSEQLRTRNGMLPDQMLQVAGVEIVVQTDELI